MTAFQWLALVPLGCLFVISIGNLFRRIGRWRASLPWAILWLACGAAIAKPDLTAAAAHVLGIGRGADLVAYVSVLAMLLGFFFVYLRLRRLERNITVLTRHVAITGARRQND